MPRAMGPPPLIWAKGVIKFTGNVPLEAWWLGTGTALPEGG